MNRVLFLACLLITHRNFAQCPFAVNLNSSGNGCLGTTLNVATGSTLSKIVWEKDGAPVSTVMATAANSTSGVTVAGGNGYGSDPNQLWGPMGVSVDKNGNIYVLETDNCRVTMWAPGATIGITVAGGNGFGSDANQLNWPTGLYVDDNGNVYVADAVNNRVQKWPPGATNGITVAGGNGAGLNANQLNDPWGVFVDATGNIYVTDSYNNRVQKWAPGATSGITVAGGNGAGSNANQFNGPLGISVDGAGNIYVVDELNKRVQKWAPGATIGITVAGGNGTGGAANQFLNPSGISVDAYGNLFVVDQGLKRIQEWMPGATSGITVAGGNGEGPDADQLSGVYSVYADTHGNLFMTDDGNERVQKWTLGSSINTSYTPLSPGTYTAVVTDNSSCTVTTNAVVINASLTPTISISTPTTAVNSCDPVTFTAYPSNPGTTPVYQWQLNGVDAGTNTPLFVDVHPVNDDVISCFMTSNAVCATPVSVNTSSLPLTVSPLPPVILTNTGTDCLGNAALEVVSPDVLSRIIWNKDGVAAYTTTATPVNIGYTPSEAGVYTAFVTTGSGCSVTTNTVTVNPTITSSLSITASAANICQGSPVTFTATPVNGGNTPVFQWQINGVNAGPNDVIYTNGSLTNRAVISCIMTPDAVCPATPTSASNTVDMVVNPVVTPSVSISTSSGTVCSGQPITFLAMPVNGGPGPDYKWQVNGIDVNNSGPGFTTNSLQDEDKVSVRLSGNASCSTKPTATSNVIPVSIVRDPGSTVNIVISTNPVCSGTPVSFTATATKEGNAPVYQWQVNGMHEGVNSPSYTDNHPASGDIITCSLQSNTVCPAVLSNSLPLIVNASPAVEQGLVFSISPGQDIILNPAITGDIAGYSWTPATGLSDATIADPAAGPAGTTVYDLKVVTSEGCEASGTITVKVFTQLKLPNAFTPNGDGKNDIFYVMGGPAGSVIANFAVFNRWGQRIFQVHDVAPGDPGYGWNGYSGGSPAPTGAYVYLIEMKFGDGTSQMVKGTVMLVR
jgi:gliding motility-associated-like protein